MLKIRLFRFDPDQDKEPHYDELNFEIPSGEKWTAIQVLDQISTTIDPTIAYYKHSVCYHGRCKRCTLRVNHKVVLACQEILPYEGEIQFDPVSVRNVVKDLVSKN